MKIGYTGLLNGKKNHEQGNAQHTARNKAFVLPYDQECLKLYSYAKITIGDQVITTDKAMWDTGANITCISHAIANGIGATPDDSGTSISATDRRETDIYLATIELPGGIVFHNVEVLDVGLFDLEAEVIIGMDIISRGKLVVETANGIPQFSFIVKETDL